MRILIFAAMGIAATSAFSYCTPHSTYEVGPEEISGGATCYCDHTYGLSAFCHTIYGGSNFTFTQTADDNRGNLAICLPNGKCHQVPQKKDLPRGSLSCIAVVAPGICTAEYYGLTIHYLLDSDDNDLVGTVILNGTSYVLLPRLHDGQPRGYL